MGAKLTARDVLEQLDEDARMRRAFFPDFDHGGTYHVDQRLSAYGGDGEQWVVVIEQLGVNPREWRGGMRTNLYYHGNAITLPPQEGWGEHAVQSVWPVEAELAGPLFADESEEEINLAATSIRIRGRSVPIRTDENYYWARKIDSDRLTHEQIDEWIKAAREGLPAGVAEEGVRQYEEMRQRVGKFELRTWHLMRGLVPEHRELLLATEEERGRGVPGDLRLLVRVDEWDHPRLMEAELPSGCESFKLIAKVLASGDPGLYRPTEEPNTHWSNWPISGSL